jgi:hypothetical protein
MFGGSAFALAAADRQGTESVAAAAALMKCPFTAIGLSLHRSLKEIVPS